MQARGADISRKGDYDAQVLAKFNEAKAASRNKTEQLAKEAPTREYDISHWQIDGEQNDIAREVGTSRVEVAVLYATPAQAQVLLMHTGSWSEVWNSMLYAANLASRRPVTARNHASIAQTSNSPNVVPNFAYTSGV